MELSRPARYTLLVLAAVLLTVGLWLFWDFTVDDAYITFRYARHLAQGAGVVWEPGARVEGYTNFLWMLLLAGAARLGLPLLSTAKVLGTVSLLLTAGLIFRHVRHETGDGWAAWVAALALLAFPATYLHAVAGLETMLYALLLVWAATLAERQARALKVQGLWQVPLLVLLAGLTRPEGVLAGLVPLGYLLLRQPPALRRRTLQQTALALVLPGAVYFGWRLAYFGWLLPNTFYVKVGHFWQGLFWAAGALFLLLPLLLVLTLVPGERDGRDALVPRRLQYYAVTAVVAVLPYAVSNLLMNYAERFLFHVFPLLVVMLGLGLASLRAALPALPAGRWNALAVLLLLAVLKTGAPDPAMDLRHGYHLYDAHVALGKALAAAAVPPAHRSLAIGDAGAVPYYSGWSTVDFIGLNDTAIAHGGDPTARILQAQPALAILYSRDGQRPLGASFHLDTERLLSGYRQVAAVLWSDEYYLNVYMRQDLSPAEQQAVQAAAAPVAAAAAEHNRHTGWADWLSHVQQRGAAGSSSG